VTTPFSFVASANCVLYQRAIPVFVDVDARTGNIDPTLVADAVARLTRDGGGQQEPDLHLRRGGRGALKALLPVHAFGQPADMDPLIELARSNGLALIEDACEAIGAEYKGRRAGTLGDAAAFAFYPNKQMTTGEGGAVAVQTEEEWVLLKSLSNQGRSDSGEWLTHSRLGYNYRLDDISAALGLAQVEKLDRILELRAEVAARYAELLGEIEGVEIPLADDADHKRSWFVYVVQVAEGIERNGVMAKLGEQGIASKPYLPSIHLQPYWRERFGTQEGMFPVSEETSRRSLALPFHTRLERADQERVAEVLASSLR
jgi:dTDP-4-amino-4,6-dideoxygalactose transaminase